MPRASSPYNRRYYMRARAALLASRPCCHWCGGPGADSADHDPPLYLHSRPHRDGSGCCVLRAAHLRCNIRHSGGWRAVTAVRERNRRRQVVPPSRKW